MLASSLVHLVGIEIIDSMLEEQQLGFSIIIYWIFMKIKKNISSQKDFLLS